jgi:hypothetical protein
VQTRAGAPGPDRAGPRECRGGEGGEGALHLGTPGAG